MRSFLSLTLFVALVAFSSSAFARSHRTDDVPNSADPILNENGGSCGLCHISDAGGGIRTGFGSQVESGVGGANDSAQWDLVFDLDADRDGYPNGVELGDPLGQWSMGDANPAGPIYNPNDPDSNPCGDGVLQMDYEDCEEDADLTSTCESLGFGPGTVVCTNCRENASGCEGANPNNVNNTMNNANNVNNVNNANNANNVNNTNNTNQTNNDETSEDDGGCSTTNAGSNVWLLLLLGCLIAVRRRRI